MNVLSLLKPDQSIPRANEPQKTAYSQLKPESLEDVLEELAKWGKPRVGMYGSDGTWNCSVEVNITATGVKFEAASDFKQLTPLSAAKQCREHLLAAAKLIGGKA